jgi:hypothetical protein
LTLRHDPRTRLHVELPCSERFLAVPPRDVCGANASAAKARAALAVASIGLVSIGFAPVARADEPPSAPPAAPPPPAAAPSASSASDDTPPVAPAAVAASPAAAPPVASPAAVPAPSTLPPAPSAAPTSGRFEFGSYGRVIAGTDARGGPGRDADIVWYGSRLDEDNYAELEFRREDHWSTTDVDSTIVMTIATQSPIFHYNAKFEADFAVRNLYLETRNVGTQGMSAWAGSRMVRGDDLYLLNLWPLDNLNLLGAGAGYRTKAGSGALLAVGATQPDSPFFRQDVVRPAPLGQFGSSMAPLLDRQKFIGAAKLVYNHRLDEGEGPGPGIKAVLYGEGHAMSEGRFEPEPGAEDELLPSDGGFVVGGQFTAYTGERDGFVHVFARYASGLAAYGQFGTPGQLALDETTQGARELLFAAGGNIEVDLFGMMLAAYVRSFRDASEGLNFEDVDEAAVVARPTLFLGELFGVSLEGAFELAQRGAIAAPVDDPLGIPEGPKMGTVTRIGIMPYISPAGRGNFKRPQLRLIYDAAFRSDVARSFYPVDHPGFLRSVEHFVGLGAEWWFNSTSYGF